MGEFFKKLIHSGVIAGSKLASGLVLAKLLAIYSGPTGFAQFAQFQNLVQLGGGIAGGGIGQGLIRHLAENEDRKHRQHYLAIGFFLGLVLTMFGAIVILLISFLVGERIFTSDSFAWGLLATGALCVSSIMNLGMSSLNGLGKSGLIALGQGAGALVTITCAWWLMREMGALGAGVGVLFGAMIAGLAAILGLHKAFPGFVIEWKSGQDAIFSLLKYVAMSIGAAITFPVSLVFVRTVLGEEVSWDEAGQWSALWRLSEAYLLVVTTLMSLYYLPRLAKARVSERVKMEINSGLSMFVPLAVVLAFIAYFFSEWIVSFFLSDKFARVPYLLGFQIVGDSVRIAAWLHGNYFWARGDALIFIVIQIVFSLSFAVFCWMGILLFHSAEGCVLGYVMNSLVHFLVVRRLVIRRIDREGEG